MKKLFTLAAMLLCVCLGSSAQDKKQWEFTNGWVSEQTIANLVADSKWTTQLKDDGSFDRAFEASKQSGPFMANGELILELEGLSLGTAGLSSSNNVIIFNNRLRVNRNNMELILPKLKGGQTVKLRARSANADATNRGFKAGYDYMEVVQQPEGGLCPGGNKESADRDDDGNYTFIWKISDSVTEESDVKIVAVTGGLDIVLIQIDEGDVPLTSKVLYFSNGDDDTYLPNILRARENTEVTVVDVATVPSDMNEAAAFASNLAEQNDVLVISPLVPANHSASSLARSALPFMPVLNFNSTLYTAWGYGQAIPTNGFVKIKSPKNGLFKGVEYEESEEGNVLIVSQNAYETQMMAVNLGYYFEGDDVLAVGMDEAAPVAIHTHNINHNGYIYFPYVTDYTDAAVQAIHNAINLLTSSKAPITNTPAPVFSREYKDQQTIVTISPSRSLPKTIIYYTTDGTTPSVFSTTYREPITITEPCTVKAVAIAEGYNMSEASAFNVKVKAQPKTPAIATEESEGFTTITLSCETELADIWYNFDNTTDTIKSSRYIEPVIIKMPATITVFALDTLERGEEVWSEAASQRVLVKNPRVVIDVAGHFRASKWDDVANGGGVFPIGKTATSMYDTSADPIGTTVDPETGDETPLYPEVEWMVRDEPGDAPEWQIMSKGQSVLWQNLTAQTGQIGTNEGGYFPSVAEDIDPLFPITSYDIQFYNIFAGEPANAAIMSKNKYQGPLDIVTIANMQGGPILAQVSADGKEWTTVGDEIAKTGYSRMWKKYVNSYDGNDEVYVRVAQTTGGAGAKIFDIYVANAGEKSQALLAELQEEYLNGIEDVQMAKSTVPAGIYSISGSRLTSPKRGLNIVVGTNGKAKKVMIK